MKHHLQMSCLSTLLLISISAHSSEPIHSNSSVTDQVIKNQRLNLAKNTQGKEVGPQAPRDIDHLVGNNKRLFAVAPAYVNMNLCNIHFHKNAEHKGGEFTVYAGNGDGHGYNSGYKYSGNLSQDELQPVHDIKKSKTEHSNLAPGDTIEVHFVYSTASVMPGPTLNSCFSEFINNPQLRVESQIYVLVNDEKALNFEQIAINTEKNGYQQTLQPLPKSNTAVEYNGSTTGPSYNEIASPYQVTWQVRKEVLKLDINSVSSWLQGNIYQENHAHGVRNLVTNPALLSGN